MPALVVPVILCGGSGLRLWPLSTQSCPKPFIAPLGGNGSDTLYQQALRRASGSPFMAPAIVVTDVRHATLAREQAAAVGRDIHLVLEHGARDSCAAALAGVMGAEKKYGRFLAAILAADQHIPDDHAFRETLSQSLTALSGGGLLLFGVRPRGPLGQFGYVVPGAALPQPGIFRVDRFVEKPDALTAAALIAAGALWNSGNFLVDSATLLAAARRHAAPVLDCVLQAVVSASPDGTASRLGSYGAACPAISLDRAIMEKEKDLLVRAVDYFWSDLGTWDEVHAMAGEASNFIHSPDRTTRVVGLEGIIVVVTDDGVLVTRAGQAEALKSAVGASDSLLKVQI